MNAEVLKQSIRKLTGRQLILLAATNYDLELPVKMSVKNMRKAILERAEQMNLFDKAETEEEQAERIEAAAVLAKDEPLTSVQQKKLYDLQREIEVKRSSGTIRELEVAIPAWHIRLDDLVG